MPKDLLRAQRTNAEDDDGASSKAVLLGERRSAQGKHWLAISIGLLVLLGVAIVPWLMTSAEPSYVTEPVRRGSLKVTVSAAGKLAPTDRVDVGTELSGIISRVLVDNNDRVTKGQSLAELDSSKLDDAIKRAQAAVRVAEANVGVAAATMGETRATLARLRELWRLSGGKAPAKAELDTAEAASLRAQATFEAASAEVSRARAQLSTDETDRAKAAIRAPIDGVVLTRQAEPGQTVAASFQTPVLFTIAGDLTTMKLEVGIDEADIGQVKAGQAATFSVDAFPDRVFPATIIRINLGPKTASVAAQGAAPLQTSSAAPTSVVTYMAVLTVSNTDGLLRPGMTAIANIVTSDKTDVLLAPNAAFRFKPVSLSDSSASSGILAAAFGDAPSPELPVAERPGAAGHRRQRNLYVMGDDGRIVQITVQTGATDGQRTEIVGGDLPVGAAVVTGRRART